ncbi:MAG: TfoX/Sxy family protein [Candidatus Cloacimonetes bacterium]|nr:TfoX/Sxy family protein [Candidatus Cloacimonadota bacterium]
MSELSKLPNIGKVLENQLKEIGIKDIEQLIETGSKQTWVMIRNIDDSACLNRLYALEGAIQGIRWYGLSESVKDELRRYYNNYR